MTRLAPIALVAALALLTAGCSKPGGSSTTATPEHYDGSAKQTQTAPASVPPKFAKGDPVAGKDVFKNGPCAGCHTLQAAGTTGTVGPNLDQAKPDLTKVVDRVLNGKGGMPSFKGQLTDKQIADVSAFVFQATHTGQAQ